MKFLFEQVTVFSDKRLKGNPLAVVVGANSLSDEQMAQFAIWTNLSETCYLLQPTDELIVTRIPVLLGDGIPLFCQNEKQINYHHVKTTVYLDSLVKSHYEKSV